MKNDVIAHYQLTGICQLDIEKVVKQWDKNTCLFQSTTKSDYYELLHYNKKAQNFTKTDIKITISGDQAKELINQLDLVYRAGGFGAHKFWRKKEHII